jgi:hypothetical protein
MSTRFSATQSKRAAVWLLVAALAAITGTVSYLHALWIVHAVGTTGPVAYLVPLVPDLAIVTSSMALVEAKRLGADRPPAATVSLIVGVVVTIVQNVVAGWHPHLWHWIGALVAGLIPVVFILTFETLLTLFRIWRETLTDEPAATCGHQVATSLDAAIIAAAPYLSKRALGPAFGVSRPHVDKLLPPVPKVAADTPEHANTNGSNPDA